MSSFVVTIVGFVLCTGPLWGAALGYSVAVRGWRFRVPLHQQTED